MTDKRIVVIGAGPGGLASAMLLAAAGFDVTVVERETKLGGRTSTFEQDGFRFDRGPTFFLFPEVLEQIFELCGRNLRDEVELERLDPNYRLVFEQGGKLDATCDVARLKAAIAAICPDDAANVERYLDDNRRKFEKFRPILEAPFSRHVDVLKLPLLELLPVMRPWASVDTDLRRHFKDPRTRLAFSFQSKYLGMSPFKCPSLFTILAYLEYRFGVFHPRGGCGAVMTAMARVAAEMGVDIRLGEPARELGFDRRRIRSVHTDRRSYPADALVINADFANAIRGLVPQRLRRRWSDRRIARAKMSCSTFMLYLGVEGRYPDVAHHTIHLCGRYTEHLDSIERGHVLPNEPSIYVHNPSLIDPTLAPRGMSSLYVLVPVTHAHPNVDWSVARQTYRDAVLERLERFGMTDLRKRLRTEAVFTPADWQRDFDLHKGATFSLSHTLDQMLSLRPRNRFEDLEGVYLVGGGTHPGSGLPVIFQSARISAQLLADDLGVANAWGRRDGRPRMPQLAAQPS
jgi:phytoene desaturase